MIEIEEKAEGVSSALPYLLEKERMISAAPHSSKIQKKKRGEEGREAIFSM